MCHRTSWRQHAAEFAGPEFFCVGRDGKRMRGNTIYQAFVRARNRVGVEIAFHDLRHTGQSMAASTGATVVDLKKRLGHSSSAAALRYIHAVEGRADRLSVDVLHEDGQPRFVWDDLPVTGADYTEVLVASVMERRRWRAQYETAKQAALERDGPPVDNRSATTTQTTHRHRLDTPANGTQ
jgi:Phage integrase family